VSQSSLLAQPNGDASIDQLEREELVAMVKKYSNRIKALAAKLETQQDGMLSR
jgi:hypothetical protein